MFCALPFVSNFNAVLSLTLYNVIHYDLRDSKQTKISKELTNYKLYFDFVPHCLLFTNKISCTLFILPGLCLCDIFR